MRILRSVCPENFPGDLMVISPSFLIHAWLGDLKEETGWVSQLDGYIYIIQRIQGSKSATQEKRGSEQTDHF
jgi:hypothetical protein